MRVFVACKRVAQFSLRDKYVTDLFLQDGKITLAFEILRFFRKELLENVLSSKIVLQGCTRVPTRHVGSPHFNMHHRAFALNARFSVDHLRERGYAKQRRESRKYCN